MLRSSLKLVGVIGEGSFSVVMKAEAYDISSSSDQHCTTVAVKMLKGTIPYHIRLIM